MADYAELQVTSNFSFLRGASHPYELVGQATAHGYRAIAITDRNTLAGIVRAHSEIKTHKYPLQLIVGARLDLTDGPSLLCLPTDRAAYGRLATLLTVGKRRAKKGGCLIGKADVLAHGDGQIMIVVPPDKPDEAFGSALGSFGEAFAGAAISPPTISIAATTPRAWRISPGWRGQRVPRSSPPTMRISMRRSGVRCRTS